MSHAQSLSEAGANCFPANLGLAIDESIARKIAILSIQLRGIDYSSDQADMIRFLKQEISILENQLTEVRRHTH